MIEKLIEKFKKKVEEETRYFLNNPDKIDLKSIDKAATRCYGALCLVTEVLSDLGQSELATELGQHWDEVDRPALYDTLYKSWGL